MNYNDEFNYININVNIYIYRLKLYTEKNIIDKKCGKIIIAIC